MRQAGILAAAGLVALEESPPKLEMDHSNARRLAAAVAELPGISLDLETVETNIVIFDVSAAAMSSFAICEQLKNQGILAIPFGNAIRMVTHFDVSAADIETAIAVLQDMLR